MSYLRELCTCDVTRGAGPCAVPGQHFIQGSDRASFRGSVRPARRQGLERRGDRRRDLARGRRDGDGARHLQGDSEGGGVCEVGAAVDGRGGAAVAELLPLLPLVQLPHHALLGGHALVGGHAEVAEPVVGVLVVTGQVACGRRRGAAGRRTGRLWQRVIGGVHRAGFGL